MLLSNHATYNCGIPFLLHSTKVPCNYLWIYSTYHYTINNDCTQYNTCSTWLLDISRDQEYINLLTMGTHDSINTLSTNTHKKFVTTTKPIRYCVEWLQSTMIISLPATSERQIIRCLYGNWRKFVHYNPWTLVYTYQIVYTVIYYTT